jgi:predicted nucleic acid-binding Zn ribbon protein|tara:strand:- start:38 stop:337 length:300 start_codon:yes stop_codon:yes gene_type:complete
VNKEPVHLRSVLEQLLKDFGTPDITTVTSIIDQWEEIVGSDLATKISAVAISGSELIVRVDDPAWASQISWLENQLLDKITRLIGEEKITSIRVRTTSK